MAVFALSPGVYSQEIDLSQRVAAAASSTGAIVLESKRGPIGPVFITSPDRFLTKFGQPDPSVSFGHDSALDFLTQSNALWVYRVVNDGRYAGFTVYNDGDETSATTTYNMGFVSGGSASAYDDGGPRQVQLITFDADLTTGDEVDLDVTNGLIDTPESITQVLSAGDMDADLAALATNIANAANDITDVSGVIAERVAGTRAVRIISPENVQLTLLNLTVSSTANAEIVTDAKLFDVFAENPGKWASDNYVTHIRDLDTGTRQRTLLTFSDALVTDNTVSGTVNGFAFGPTSFVTDSDTTLAAVASEIQSVITNNLDAGAEVTVNEIPGGASNDREILVIAPTATYDLEFTGITVASGASQATVSVQETLSRVAPDGTFTFEVFNTNNLNSPVETWRVSLNEQQDGFGRQLNIAEQVNNGPDRSDYIRVYQPEYSKSMEMKNTFGNNYIALRNGDDGASATNGQISQAWDKFANREKLETRILINGGYTAVSVQQKMTALCESRKDCFAILDMPSSLQGTTDAVSHRRDSMNINSSYAGIYTPDIKIVDEFTDVNRFIPPSGKVSSTFALTDRVRNPWWSPAGLNRGLIRQAIGLREEYDQGDRDLLSQSQINYVINKTGKGIVVWNDNTLQSMDSALSYINVRRMLIQIEVAVTDALDYSVFEPNDDFLAFQLVQLVNDFLLPIQQARGIRRFQVVSDDSNNPDYIIAGGQRRLDVYIDPNLPAREIRLSTILTKTGASFEEIISGGGSLQFS